MKILKIILLSFLFIFQPVSAENNIYYDQALFRIDSSTYKLEIYYGIPDTVFDYKLSGSTYVGRLDFLLQVFADDTLFASDKWNVNDLADEKVKDYKRHLYGQREFYLPEGNFKVKTIIFRKVPGNIIFNNSTDLNLVNKFKNKISVSGIEFAHKIVKNNPDSLYSKMFIKNNLYVIPNPGAEFRSIEPVCRAYAEIYNVKTYSSEGYLVEYILLDGLKREIQKVSRKKESNSDAMMEIVNYPLDLLTTGVYYLRLVVSYNSGGMRIADTSEKKFFYINPDRVPELNAWFIESGTFEKSIFSSMSEQQVQTEFEKAKVLISPEGRDKFEMLGTVEAKQRFLFVFWNELDPDPQTQINEKYVEFRENIEYANRNFKSSTTKQGWKTDRGKVLIKYGKPSSIDRKYSEDNSRPYEIWYYDLLLGGSKFYFVDVSGSNDFILVHSTVSGEVYNPNWYNDYVKIIQDGNDIMNDNYR